MPLRLETMFWLWRPTSRRFLRQEALREFFVFAHLICRQPWSRYMTYRLGTRVIATFSKSFFITLCHAFNCYLNKTELSYRELEFAAKTNFTEKQKYRVDCFWKRITFDHHRGPLILKIRLWCHRKWYIGCILSSVLPQFYFIVGTNYHSNDR